MLLKIYEENPNPREIAKVIKTLQDGGLIIYPTDTVYAIGCDALNVRAVERICQIKGVNPQKSNLSIICYDLSNLSEYAKVSNAAFKLMKKNLPGPFTFILPTSNELPKIYKNRKEVGIRVPDNNIVRTIVQELRTQARIDSGIQTIVGVNKYRLPKEDPIDILEIDNTAVRNEQIELLKQLRANRDEAAVQKALADITECVKTKKGNLLDLAVKAAAVRATLGEISDACEAVVGRYKAIIRTISGVYSSETKKDADFEKACQLTAEFAKKEGRQPRIMIAKMGQDGHDRGAKVVATGYADCGFDVDMGPLFQTPAEAARQAVENDVHVMGVSSLAAGHKTLVPQVIEELKKLGREDIIVIAGGVIPAQDYDFLYKAGVAAIFGPGTSVSKAAVQILEILLGE